MSHSLNWFELPVHDLPRATRFYEQLLHVTFKREEAGDTTMAIFVAAADEVKGALLKSPRRHPSADGTLIYLNANGQLDACLARLPTAGGKLVMPKTDIGAPGFIALIQDPEGNVVGLHSEKP